MTTLPPEVRHARIRAALIDAGVEVSRAEAIAAEHATDETTALTPSGTAAGLRSMLAPGCNCDSRESLAAVMAGREPPTCAIHDEDDGHDEPITEVVNALFTGTNTGTSIPLGGAEIDAALDAAGFTNGDSERWT